MRTDEEVDNGPAFPDNRSDYFPVVTTRRPVRCSPESGIVPHPGHALRHYMAVTKALSDENRVRVLLALRRGELCVCQIVELLGLATSLDCHSLHSRPAIRGRRARPFKRNSCCLGVSGEKARRWPRHLTI